MDVIEHVSKDREFIAEKLRVASQGGLIIIGTPNRWRLTNIFLWIFGKLKYPRVIGQDTYGEILHLREYSKQDLVALVANFKEEIERESICVLPCWLGIMPLDLGISKFPALFDNMCQFWFISFRKK